MSLSEDEPACFISKRFLWLLDEDDKDNVPTSKLNLVIVSL